LRETEEEDFGRQNQRKREEMQEKASKELVDFIS